MNTRLQSKKQKANSIFDTDMAEDPTLFPEATGNISDQSFPRFHLKIVPLVST